MVIDFISRWGQSLADTKPMPPTINHFLLKLISTLDVITRSVIHFFPQPCSSIMSYSFDSPTQLALCSASTDAVLGFNLISFNCDRGMSLILLISFSYEMPYMIWRWFAMNFSSYCFCSSRNSPKFTWTTGRFLRTRAGIPEQLALSASSRSYIFFTSTGGIQFK